MLEIKKCQKLPAPRFEPHPKFGSIFGPHVLRIDFDVSQKDNLKAEIKPFEGEMFTPGTAVLHYAQSIFEGLKVYRQPDGSVAAFRADLHAKRFNFSARRLAMPEIGEKVFLDCLREYMNFESESVPSLPDHSLYIRPLLIGRDEKIKIGRSSHYTFYIMSSIAGSYFSGGVTRAAKVLVNKHFVRAFPGGTGEVKTAGNYASTLMAQAYADTLGCDQVLYLDAVHHDLVDELGGMNFFMVKEGELVTPPLAGTILDGVTRRSIIEIAAVLGMKAREAHISFSEMCRDIQSGKVTETFACGTAAIIHPIGELAVQETQGAAVSSIKLPSTFPVATKLRDTLQAMQRGQQKAPGDWLFR